MSNSPKKDRSQTDSGTAGGRASPQPSADPNGSYYYDDAYGYEEYTGDDQDDEDETEFITNTED
jgi:hypothetical protein